MINKQNTIRKWILWSLFMLTVSFSIISCKKDAGPGGTSTIVGKVWIQDYTPDFSSIVREYWAEEEDVYLVYGSDSIYSDRFRTNYDGSYWFQYLREGEYTIFAYSKDSLTIPESLSGTKPIIVKVNISGSDQAVNAPLITILD